jgi:hypothetical protein
VVAFRFELEFRFLFLGRRPFRRRWGVRELVNMLAVLLVGILWTNAMRIGAAILAGYTFSMDKAAVW